MNIVARLMLVSTGVAVSAPSNPQTQAQHDRLNRVARFVVTAPMCERLGMRLDSDLPGKAEKALQLEMASWKVDRPILEKLKIEAISRQGAVIKTDLQSAADAAQTVEQLRGVKDIAVYPLHTPLT